MPKVKANTKDGWKGIVKLIVAIIVGLLAGASVSLAVVPKDGGTEIIVETKQQLELSEDQIEATVVNEEGEEETIDAATVESVDGNQLVNEECPEGEECGKGLYAPVESPQAFRDFVYGTCVDTDGYFGSQCYDLANLFWQNYAGRTLSTCGTGAAKGIMNCYEYNAGGEFTMIWNPAELQPGDWVIFGNGQYGHIGMVMGYYNNGYIALLGTNQGGRSCAGGGAAANIINISLKNMTGAFRPNDYIIPEPEPTPTPVVDGSVEYTYVKGDYFSKVLVNLGLDEGKLWGDEGTVRYYTEQLIEQDMLDINGNVKIGEPFTLEVR